MDSLDRFFFLFKEEDNEKKGFKSELRTLDSCCEFLRICLELLQGKNLDFKLNKKIFLAILFYQIFIFNYPGKESGYKLRTLEDCYEFQIAKVFLRRIQIPSR